jgi:undecaprenyl-phosphate 4-deoxy-4-formamido-L-arabinose transferase
MKNKYSISIIIPVFNSEKTIEIVCNKIKDVSKDNYYFEIILVNDNSQDNSLNICKTLTEKNNCIILLNLAKNFGQHAALLAGLNYATGDYIVFLDDDLQTPPEEITNLIAKLEEGYDVVYANYKSKKHSKFQNIGSKINDIMANIILKKPKNLRITSYFIIKKFLATEILKYTGPYPYLAGLILRSTNNIGILNIDHKERVFGKTNYNFIKLFRLWLNGYTNFSIKPLRMSFILGISTSIISFILAIIFTIRKIIDPNIFIGWTSIIVALFFFFGLQLILIGLIGEYVGRVFLTLNKQPQYVIKDIYNYKK